MLIILALWRPRQESHEFKVSQDYIVRLCEEESAGGEGGEEEQVWVYQNILILTASDGL